MDTPKNPALTALTARNFPSAQEEAATVPPAGLYAGPESAYRLAFTDSAFLLREELRPVRMQLELLKPELVQREQGVESTIVIFGSARIQPPDVAAQLLLTAQASDDDAAIRRAETAVAMSRYYDEARRFAALATRRSRDHETPLFVVTGGGPDIMGTAVAGFHDAGATASDHEKRRFVVA